MQGALVLKDQHGPSRLRLSDTMALFLYNIEFASFSIEASNSGQSLSQMSLRWTSSLLVLAM